jgi:hypothetical protein
MTILSLVASIANNVHRSSPPDGALHQSVACIPAGRNLTSAALAQARLSRKRSLHSTGSE